MYLVNPHFIFPSKDTFRQGNESEPIMTFFSLEEWHKIKHELPHSEGNRRDQLMCVPAIDQVDIQVRWYREIPVSRGCKSRIMSKVITVGEFVRTLRRLLEYAVTDIKKFARQLEVTVCERCREDGA